ncbi:EAL domain-containing protein [Romeria aff. gracilis LEGE 07310]|uniref:EAL domain-containing protein n=1 Tax=Vasconcelosia minhoensis LEGE 07310 TaxID=915328 RepID=A0A8J7AKG4_9CYAN|nr:EAL domain-containing protein [Romeria gracilis]MBE9075721.1 EAL domain-containing protein [Romeria aff. gracilis LEGE 07310]
MSSFAYLSQLPVDYIKIDGSFINKLNDPINYAIVGSICKIGQAMNIHVIAEWLEDDAVGAQLQTLGVDSVQGYGVAKPAPFFLS